MSRLTKREREVFLWLAAGLTNEQLASVLGITDAYDPCASWSDPWRTLAGVTMHSRAHAQELRVSTSQTGTASSLVDRESNRSLLSNRSRLYNLEVVSDIRNRPYRIGRHPLRG
ncbi:LuxR C-terminal-related transcriptional regulator [Salinispora vitiensis]|uniref:LuxR C-terminal-related transcriptional regulator n=1 Tax=Salinispora vitiensis TaxID=999544 RepID=UPI001CC56554